MNTTVIPQKTVTKIKRQTPLTPDRNKYNLKRVAAYCRVSTDLEEQLSSYNAQKEYYTDKIMKNPEWEFAGLYADEGISGTHAKNRKEFLKLIKACERGKVDYIITKSLSRFAKNAHGRGGVIKRYRWCSL
ncbi:MAG: hypothetical protein A2Y17_05080 [Clostridiales bacterium GWF2_38_85]|nr:MAG: hypothetical protein A2Y17_05080 [Clostridiales bacterium GWF2_38_85]HBL84338.1 hypothetical protein [Clostridiales bacterium]